MFSLLILMILCLCTLQCNVHNIKKSSVVYIESSKTLSEGILDRLTPGDTLLFDDGIYDFEFFANIPSGNDWSSPITLMARPGAKPIIQPQSGSRVFHFGKYKGKYPMHHIEIRGLVLDGANVKSDVIKITHGAHHIRIVDCEIKNSKNQGILITHLNSTNNEIINCKIYENGTNDFKHGIYISTDYNLVKKCEIYQNAGSGINIYNGKGSANYNLVVDCHIHHNARVGKRGVGVGLHTGKGNQAVGNLIHDNKTGIHTDYKSYETLIENNIIYNHPGYDLIVGLDAGTYTIQKNILLKESSNPEIQIRASYPQTLEGQTILFKRSEMENIKESWMKKKQK